MAAITRTEVQTWVAELAGRLAPATVRGVYRLVAQVMRAAVEDRCLGDSPCRKIALPEQRSGEITPLTLAQLSALANATIDRYQAAVWLAAGTGMRLGEVLGLTVDRIDFLRRTIKVDRQLQDRVLVPPKTKASVRAIPVADETLEVLAAHLARVPAIDGRAFSSTRGEPLRRQTWHGTWPRATARAGLPGTRFHDLRHFYASALIAAGLSVKVVQARLGHKTAQETLDTYGHLWPDDEDRTRHAVSEALAVREESARSAESPRNRGLLVGTDVR